MIRDRRYWSMVLAVGCIAGLAGCAHAGSPVEEDTVSGAENSGSTGEESSGTSSEEASASPDSAESCQPETEETTETEESYKDGTKLTWYYNDFMTVSAAVQDAVNRVLEEQGYDFWISFVQYPETVYEEIVNQAIESNTPPDIITAGIGERGTFQGTWRAYQNHWLLQLDDYLDSDAGKALKESMPQEMWDACKVDGHYYGVSSMLPMATDYAYYVNMDIANRYGITEEEIAGCAIEDIGEILEKASQEEGCALLILGSYTGAVSGYNEIAENLGIQTSAVSVFNQSDIGEAVNPFEEESVINKLKAIASYREKGYIWLEGDTEPENFFIEIDAINRFVSGDGTGYKSVLKEKYKNCGEIEAIPYMAAPITTRFNSLTGVCSGSENQEMALQALTATMTIPEISDLLLLRYRGTGL